MLRYVLLISTSIFKIPKKEEGTVLILCVCICLCLSLTNFRRIFRSSYYFGMPYGVFYASLLFI